jgi:hypothetical protein
MENESEHNAVSNLVLREALDRIKQRNRCAFPFWANWGNWRNWGNWGNWHNWGNWGNWIN